jgi:ATP-dependent RNA helicase DDX51/DBP6
MCRCNFRVNLLPSKKPSDIHISYIRLVCSDLISRGIDISHVSHVVSYDVPVDMRKYVHHVGTFIVLDAQCVLGRPEKPGR